MTIAKVSQTTWMRQAFPQHICFVFLKLFSFPSGNWNHKTVYLFMQVFANLKTNEHLNIKCRYYFPQMLSNKFKCNRPASKTGNRVDRVECKQRTYLSGFLGSLFHTPWENICSGAHGIRVIPCAAAFWPQFMTFTPWQSELISIIMCEIGKLSLTKEISVLRTSLRFIRHYYYQKELNNHPKL